MIRQVENDAAVVVLSKCGSVVLESTTSVECCNRRLQHMRMRRQQQQQQHCVPGWQPRITQFLESASTAGRKMEAVHDVAVKLVAPAGQQSHSGQSRAS